MSNRLADRVEERTVGSCRLLMLPAPVDDVVTWRASFMTNPDLNAGHDVVQELTVSLLDKGTAHRDRFEVAQVLEECGAQLNVSSDGLYVDAAGRSLTRDFGDVMDVLAEMLREPAFSPDEVEKATAQVVGELQRNLDDTGTLARTALAQALFPSGHPNYREAPEEQIAQVQAITPADLRAYHDAHFGARDFTLVVVGDVDPDAIAASVDEAFGDWAPHDAPAVYDVAGRDPMAGRTTIPMPDKSNVDVRMGHTVPIRRDHDDYLALYVANYILGGNFAARLMNEVRNEQGLTYHIGSSVRGMTTRYEGFWNAVVTLSHENLERGLEATQDVIERFVEEGATEEELEAKKTTIPGGFTVGLATTKGLSRALLTNAERDFPVAYLDGFPDAIRALTLEEVNNAIRTYLHPDRLHIALAGTETPVAAEG